MIWRCIERSVENVQHAGRDARRSVGNLGLVKPTAVKAAAGAEFVGAYVSECQARAVASAHALLAPSLRCCDRLSTATATTDS